MQTEFQGQSSKDSSPTSHGYDKKQFIREGVMRDETWLTSSFLCSIRERCHQMSSAKHVVSDVMVDIYSGPSISRTILREGLTRQILFSANKMCKALSADGKGFASNWTGIYVFCNCLQCK